MRTIIEDCVIASLDGDESRLVDLPNGGEVEIRRTILEKGPNAVNWELIGFGLEGLRYPHNALVLEDVLVVIDRSGALFLRGPVQPKSIRVSVVGGSLLSGPTDAEAHFSDRAAAGLTPFPDLPPPGWHLNR